MKISCFLLGADGKTGLCSGNPLKMDEKIGLKRPEAIWGASVAPENRRRKSVGEGA